MVAAIEVSRSTGMGGIPRMASSRSLEQRNAKITDVRLVAFRRRLTLSALHEVGFRLRNLFSGSRAAWAHVFGEPLVGDPREAIRSFYCAGIDALAIGAFFIVK